MELISGTIYYNNYISLQQPAVKEVETEYTSHYNSPVIADYAPIASINTVSPNISSFRSVGDYAFYNLYSNYLDGEKNTKGEALRYSCWDARMARYKNQQCVGSCKSTYIYVCQQRGCHQPMVTRAITLCRYLCAAEFE